MKKQVQINNKKLTRKEKIKNFVTKHAKVCVYVFLALLVAIGFSFGFLVGRVSLTDRGKKITVSAAEWSNDSVVYASFDVVTFRGISYTMIPMFEFFYPSESSQGYTYYSLIIGFNADKMYVRIGRGSRTTPGLYVEDVITQKQVVPSALVDYIDYTPYSSPMPAPPFVTFGQTNSAKFSIDSITDHKAYFTISLSSNASFIFKCPTLYDITGSDSSPAVYARGRMLLRGGSSVGSPLLSAFDYVLYNRADIIQEGYNDGYTAGKADGKQEGLTEGYNNGYTAGKADGKQEGLTEGKEQGYITGLTMSRAGILACIKTVKLSVSAYNSSAKESTTDKTFDFQDNFSLTGTMLSLSQFLPKVNELCPYGFSSAVLTFTFYRYTAYSTSLHLIYQGDVFTVESLIVQDILSGSHTVPNKIETPQKMIYSPPDIDSYLFSMTLTLKTDTAFQGSLNAENVEYNNGYSNGFEEGTQSGQEKGEKIGYDKGKKEGDVAGYNRGFAEGSANGNSFLHLFTAVVDAPVSVFSSLFDIEILGYNMKGVFLALISVCLVFAVYRLFSGGFFK